LTINGKNYRNPCCRSYCNYSNGERWRSDFDAWTYESGVNLALTGLGLKKYIGREVGGAIAHRGRSLISTIALSLAVIEGAKHAQRELS